GLRDVLVHQSLACDIQTRHFIMVGSGSPSCSAAPIGLASLQTHRARQFAMTPQPALRREIQLVARPGKIRGEVFRFSWLLFEVKEELFALVEIQEVFPSPLA